MDCNFIPDCRVVSFLVLDEWAREVGGRDGDGSSLLV